MSRSKNVSRQRKKLMLDEKLMSTEQIRMIRTNIEDKLKRDSLFLTITSPNLEEQKSLISAKLAISFAELGKKVLLVDANLRRPFLHKWFNMYNSSGLVDAMEDNGIVDLYAKETFITGLFLLPAGIPKENSTYTWSLSKSAELKERWSQSFDVVIMEAPSFLKYSDSHILSRQCDGVVLVMKEHSTKREEALQTKLFLDRAGREIVGVIYQTA